VEVALKVGVADRRAVDVATGVALQVGVAVGALNVNAPTSVAAWRSEFVTLKSARPGASAGVVKLNWDALIHVTATETPPKAAESAGSNPLPLTVTSVPPPLGPWLMSRELMEGATAVGLGVIVPLKVAVGLGLKVAVSLALGVMVPVWLSVKDWVAVPAGDGDPVGEADAVGVGDPVRVGVGVGDVAGSNLSTIRE